MMPSLPTELLQLIFHETPQESLRNCRLLNHQWSTASTPLVFERVHTSLFSRSLIKFTSLCNSPLAKHVKAIDFHTDQLPRYSRPAWESKLDLRPPFMEYSKSRCEGGLDRMQALQEYNKIPKHTLTPEQIEAGWQSYDLCLNEQESWCESTEGVTLRDCLVQLKNLKEVIADKARAFNRSQISDKTSWNKFANEVLIGPEAWSYQKGEFDDDRYERMSALFMLEAVAYRQGIAGFRPVEKLSMELPRYYSFEDMIAKPTHYQDMLAFPTTFHHLDDMDADDDGAKPDEAEINTRYSAIVDVFKSLKHLVLFCPSLPDITDPVQMGQAVETTRLLDCAKELRSLELEFGEPLRDGEDDGSGEHYVDAALAPFWSRQGQVTYPKLEEFKIGAAFPAAPFTNFLMIHKDTLRSLELKDCLSSQWDAVLLFVGKGLKLKHIYIESLWGVSPGEHDEDDDDLDIFETVDSALRFGEGLDEDDPYVRDMKRFLLTGEGEIPLENDYVDDPSGEEYYDDYDGYEYDEMDPEY